MSKYLTIPGRSPYLTIPNRSPYLTIPQQAAAGVGGGGEEPSGNTYSLSFDGANDYVDISGVVSLLNPTEGTIECWVKMDSSILSDSAVHGIVEVGYSGGRGQFIALRKAGNDTLIARYRESDTNYDAVLSDLTGCDAYRHYACVWDASTIYLYVDGSLVDSTNRGSDATDLDIAYIGVDAQGGFSDPEAEYYHKGLVDDLRVWSDKRTQSEIDNNKDKELVGNEAGLIGYWKLNDGSGSTAEDATANNNDGTLHNSPTWSTDTPF